MTDGQTDGRTDMRIPIYPRLSSSVGQKNLFSYIKSMKNDNIGIAALRKDGIQTDKADILNEQFKKAFSIETSSEQIPDKGKSSYPLMNSISISESGVTKLLHNINPHKATE